MTTRKGPITFEVVGSSHFPADMLRYDGCYPASSHDAVEMASSWDSRSRPRERRITLRTHLEGRPTEGRWESFGWKVEWAR